VKRTLIVAALAVMALMSSIQPAQANILDWMQEWSGPGPFREGGSGLFTWCRFNYNAEKESDQNEHPCLFFDLRRLVAVDKDNFPVQVTAKFLDVGWTWRVRRPLEVGVGVGMMSAEGNKTAVRPTITVPRVVVKPALLVAELLPVPKDLLFNTNRKPSRLFHIVKLYVRGNFILGQLNGQDLGVNRSSYNRTNEFVLSRGLLIDLGELLVPDLSGAR
jgi:hypothetical protein